MLDQTSVKTPSRFLRLFRVVRELEISLGRSLRESRTVSSVRSPRQAQDKDMPHLKPPAITRMHTMLPSPIQLL
jgi:hypothetical protein